MKTRPTSPRIAEMKKEVLAARKGRRGRKAEPSSARYLLAFAGVALLAGIVFTTAPSDPPKTVTVAEQPGRSSP